MLKSVNPRWLIAATVGCAVLSACRLVSLATAPSCTSDGLRQAEVVAKQPVWRQQARPAQVFDDCESSGGAGIEFLLDGTRAAAIDEIPPALNCVRTRPRLLESDYTHQFRCRSGKTEFALGLALQSPERQRKDQATIDGFAEVTHVAD